MSVDQQAVFAEHAYKYSELGWALIRVNGKRPKDSEWQTAAPLEPGFAAGQWSQWGGRYGIGVVLGPSRLAVFEYDDENAHDRFLELLGGDLPHAPICRTGSGKLHVYFTDPGNVTKGARDRLELRVGRHQCLVPPSIHPDTGQAYAWLPEHEPWRVPLPPPPTRVLEFFHADTKWQNGTAATTIGDLIPIGEIDTTLTSLAGTMRRRGMSEDAICAALVAELPRCQEGHTHTEADCRRIARSVSSYEPADVPPTEQLEPFELSVQTARTICALPDPPGSDELLGPAVVRGQRIVLGGHTGEGKTTLALQIVRTVIGGGAVARLARCEAVRVRSCIDAEQGFEDDQAATARSWARRLRPGRLHACPRRARARLGPATRRRGRTRADRR